MSGSGIGGRGTPTPVTVTYKYETEAKFVPFEIPRVTPGRPDANKLTCTTTIRGEAASDFETLCERSGLNKSQMLTQMVYHCLGRSSELKEFYKRVAILGK